jgi:drug/metabolite transporter (DMT)-like permease
MNGPRVTDSRVNSDARRQSEGLVVAVVAASAWGISTVFVVLTIAPGLVVTFYRLWISSALFLVILYGSGRRMNRVILRATWLGGLFLAANMAMFFSAIKFISVVDVMVISAVQPAVVLIAARRIFGERMGRWDVMWIVLSMVGVCMAVLGPGQVSSHHQLIGDLLAVGAMICWSGYWLVSKHARAVHDALEYTVGVTVVAAVAITPIVLMSGQSIVRVASGDWFWIVLLAIVPGGGHLLMNWAHRYVVASVTSVIGCLAPLVAAVSAWVILGQRLSAFQCGGLLIGLTSIAVVAARQREAVWPLPE